MSLVVFPLTFYEFIPILYSVISAMKKNNGKNFVMKINIGDGRNMKEKMPSKPSSELKDGKTSVDSASKQAKELKESRVSHYEIKKLKN